VQSNYLLALLAAATILSNGGSPRNDRHENRDQDSVSSQHGFKRRSPHVRPFGIVTTVSSCSSALACPRINRLAQIRRSRNAASAAFQRCTKDFLNRLKPRRRHERASMSPNALRRLGARRN